MEDYQFKPEQSNEIKAMRYLLKVNPSKYSVKKKQSPRGHRSGLYFVLYEWKYFFPLGPYQDDIAYIRLGE